MSLNDILWWGYEEIGYGDYGLWKFIGGGSLCASVYDKQMKMVMNTRWRWMVSKRVSMCEWWRSVCIFLLPMLNFLSLLIVISLGFCKGVILLQESCEKIVWFHVWSCEWWKVWLGAKTMWSYAMRMRKKLVRKVLWMVSRENFVWYGIRYDVTFWTLSSCVDHLAFVWYMYVLWMRMMKIFIVIPFCL